MSAELHLDPDGLRRAAVTACRIADGLDRADPGTSAAGPAGVGVGHVEERLRESVRRARDELLALASAASAAAARADETDRAVAASLRAADPGAADSGAVDSGAVDPGAGGRSPGAVADRG
ncbi:hypothetical protein [Pseudonocardia sp. KRD291]|uniref:hypothetical protein n=1 Tax=Pseudonocardia sp. KRD291 TaxID=2792007 RepID=UPI001C4A0785|nr:hypothetical protein [Pseudonocardia sp. KRD291]MBW0105536.1 hypothetical protein [Pseudonocardia sp. KRD291]